MSNRLTFSLASLIVLLALGLVFAPVSVMAHPNVAGQDPADMHAAEGHMHPEIMISATDANPNTAAIEITQKADSDSAPLTLEFDLMVTFPSSVTTPDGSAIADGTLAASAPNTPGISIVAHNSDFDPVGAGTGGAVAMGTITRDELEFTVPITLTIVDPADTSTATTQAAAVTAAIEAGLMIRATVDAGIIRSSRVGGAFENQLNVLTRETFTVIAESVDEEEEPDPEAPAAPMNLMAEEGNGQVTLTWDTVDGATEYEYSKDDDGLFWAMIPADDITMDADAGTSSYTVMGLTNGAEYMFRVRAGNSVGTGEASASVSESPMGPMTEYGVTASLSDDGMMTSLSGMIKANGFVVVEAANLPDLQEFFDIGGTIGVDDGDGAADNNSRTVVISEILWGLDFGATLIEDQKQWQFIELYNTTNADINLAGWSLNFTEGRPVPASDIDQVSNRSGVGWKVDIGQSGRVTGTRAVDPNEAVTAINIISMYRNINYDKVETEAAKATVNRGELLKGVPGGNAKGSWKASTRRDPNTPDGVGITGAQAARWIYSTRGRQHYTTTAILTASAVKGSPFRINEIGNDDGSENDWVELYNNSDAAQSLKNYQLTVVTAQGTDTELHDFTGDAWDNRKIPAGGFLVISTRHPRDTDLAGGKNIEVADDEELNRGASHLFVVKNVNLPDDGKFALILRGGHGDGHKSQGTGNHLIDVVATRKGSFAHANIGTSLWPLTATGQPHGNVIDGETGGDETFKKGFVYQRDKGNGRGEKDFKVRGYTGIGYDRDAADIPVNGGTPGYDNGALKDKVGGLTEGEITISEIMVDAGEGRQNLAQWIELYNSSMTQAVNLAGWKLHIENAANGDGELETNTFSATLTLGTMTISPNQTVLIATTTGLTSDPDHFPSNRVVNLWIDKNHRNALEMVRRTDPVLSSVGFNITLADKDNKTVDEVGNLDGNRRTRDEPAWPLPMSEDDGRRSSLVRVYDDGVAIDGMMADAWVSADATNLAWAISHTYYGNPDDFGTPGFRAGGPLPVQLSKFRPERLDDGSIVVRWITESELDNAGFNILRSETRDGEFTKLNAQLIEGQGTTSERNTYDFVDTTAKPNVVYYYQIQDVSLDGKVQTLRQSRLKGHVSPAGKITTTWGDIKALQ